VEPNAFADHYSVLGIKRTASLAEIRRAYREKVLQYHPDRNPQDPEARSRFLRVAEAYAILSHSEKKRAYDTLFSVPTTAPTPASVSPAKPVAPRPFRVRYEANLNALRSSDAFWGSALSASAYPFLFFSPSLSEGVGLALDAILLSVAGAMCVFLGGMVGQMAREWLGALGEMVFRIREIGDATEVASPIVLAALFPVVFVWLVSPNSEMASVSYFGVLLGAGFTAMGAASIGRAVTHSPEPLSHPRWGRLVAGILGVCGGVVSGLFFTAATSDVFAGLAFSSLLATNTGASALGAGLAAAFGATRDLGEEP
jgi:uncharacterized membrane protein HdeD (DUF308 family)